MIFNLQFQSQFQQQLNRSQSLLMVGQQQNNLYPQQISPSDESDDDLMHPIKLEPKLELSPPELISTMAPTTSSHHFSMPSPASTSSTPLLSSFSQALSQSSLNSPYCAQIKQEASIDSLKVGLKKKNNILTSSMSTVTTSSVTQSEQLQKLQKHQKQLQSSQGKSGQNLITIANYTGKVKPATLSDLEGIDMMHLPVDLDEAGNIDIMGDMDEMDDDDDQMPELMQETHACFLSLIRDIFCSTVDHRATLENLQKKILQWLSNPITPSTIGMH